jgi:hypothetical protein
MTESAARLSGPQAGLHTVVADLDGEVTGFAHVIFDADPAWGPTWMPGTGGTT